MANDFARSEGAFLTNRTLIGEALLVLGNMEELYTTETKIGTKVSNKVIEFIVVSVSGTDELERSEGR